MSQSDEARYYYEHEAVGHLLEEMSKNATEMNSLRHALSIVRAEEVDLRAAVITLQDAQGGLRGEVAALHDIAQDIQNEIAGHYENDELWRNETQTKVEEQRDALMKSIDNLRADVSVDDTLRCNVAHLRVEVQEMREHFINLSEQDQDPSEQLPRDHTTAEMRTDSALSTLKTREDALDEDAPGDAAQSPSQPSATPQVAKSETRAPQGENPAQQIPATRIRNATKSNQDPRQQSTAKSHRIIVPDSAAANTMVDRSLSEFGTWIYDNVDLEARKMWWAAPWLVKILISHEGKPPREVRSISAVLTNRIQEAKDYIHWNTRNITADRQRRLNVAWQIAYSRVPAKFNNWALR